MKRFVALAVASVTLSGALVTLPAVRAGSAVTCRISTTLRRYAVSNDVLCLEQRLTELRHVIVNGPDRSFGLSTHNAVVAFQRSNRLATDGIVGPLTARALGILGAAAPCAGISLAAQRAASKQQVVVVRAAAGATALVDLIVGGRAVLCGVPARIGRAGLRPLAQRIAGDGTTPSGVFDLASMTAPDGTSFSFFGNGTNPGVVAGTWRQVRVDDCWDATPGDAVYNTLVRRARAACRQPDEHLASYGAVYSGAALIGANMGATRSGDAPGEVGRAGAIFLHRHSYDSAGNARATSGCVSLNATNLAIVLRALKPGQAAFVIG